MSRTEGLTSQQTANGNRAPRTRRGASFRAKTEHCEEDCGVNGDLDHSAMMTLETPPCRGLPGGYPTPLNVFCMPCPPSSLAPPGILSFSPPQHDMGLPPSLSLSHPSPGSDHGGKLSPGQPEDFLCRWQDCQRVFDHLDDLVNHVNDHHIKLERPDVDYQCRWTDCPRQGRGFNARYKMLIHVRTHTNEKPHRCALCGKSFSRLENLKIHHRSHTGEKPYVCPVEGCGKAYSNSSDRFKHVRTHQEEKPYICRAPGCLKRYTDPSSLRKHIRTHNHHFRSSGEHVTPSNGSATTNGVTPRSRGSNSHSQSPPLQYSSQSSPPAHAHRLSPSTPSLQHSPAHGLMSPLPPQMLPVQDGLGVGMLSDAGPLHGSLFTSAIITSSPHVTSSTMATELLPTMLHPGSVAAHSGGMAGGLVMLDVKQEHYGHCQEGPLDLSRTPLSKKQHLLVATVTH